MFTVIRIMDTTHDKLVLSVFLSPSAIKSYSLIVSPKQCGNNTHTNTGFLVNEPGSRGSPRASTVPQKVFVGCRVQARGGFRLSAVATNNGIDSKLRSGCTQLCRFKDVYDCFLTFKLLSDWNSCFYEDGNISMCKTKHKILILCKMLGVESVVTFWLTSFKKTHPGGRDDTSRSDSMVSFLCEQVDFLWKEYKLWIDYSVCCSLNAFPNVCKHTQTNPNTRIHTDCTPHTHDSVNMYSIKII